MEDLKIIDLYWQRSEMAIDETASKYARYLHSISFNILHDNEDAKECLNDTYFRAWNAMPPSRPNCLSTFLGKIMRNLSLDKYKYYSAAKRKGGQTELALSELDEIISGISVEQEAEENELREMLNKFLKHLPKQKRVTFLRRYWYLLSIKEIAEKSKTSESQIKSTLFRLRNELKTFLESEGIGI